MYMACDPLEGNVLLFSGEVFECIYSWRLGGKQYV